MISIDGKTPLLDNCQGMARCRTTPGMLVSREQSNPAGGFT
jgi:hypothetical protein